MQTKNFFSMHTASRPSVQNKWVCHHRKNIIRVCKNPKTISDVLTKFPMFSDKYRTICVCFWIFASFTDRKKHCSLIWLFYSNGNRWQWQIELCNVMRSSNQSQIYLNWSKKEWWQVKRRGWREKWIKIYAKIRILARNCVIQLKLETE